MRSFECSGLRGRCLWLVCVGVVFGRVAFSLNCIYRFIAGEFGVPRREILTGEPVLFVGMTYNLLLVNIYKTMATWTGSAEYQLSLNLTRTKNRERKKEKNHDLLNRGLDGWGNPITRPTGLFVACLCFLPMAFWSDGGG